MLETHLPETHFGSEELFPLKKKQYIQVRIPKNHLLGKGGI